jgi:hypothetical protein
MTRVWVFTPSDHRSNSSETRRCTSARSILRMPEMLESRQMLSAAEGDWFQEIKTAEISVPILCVREEVQIHPWIVVCFDRRGLPPAHPAEILKDDALSPEPAADIADLDGSPASEAERTWVTQGLSVALANNTPQANSAIGTVFGTFMTAGGAPGERWSYRLVAGEGDGGNAFFTIDGDTIASAVVFDCEFEIGYTIRVQAAGSSGAVIEQVITVFVTDAMQRPLATQVGDAYILFDRATGEFRLNPGHSVSESTGVNSFGVQMDPAIGTLSTDVNDYYFPAGSWDLFFPQTGANPGNAFGSAFQSWSGLNVEGGGDSLNARNLVVGSSRATQTGGKTGSTGDAIPGTTAVYASTIPGYEGLPEFSFGTFGPTDLTEAEALAALGVTSQGGYARDSVYSLQNVLGPQSFRIFVTSSNSSKPVG